VQSHNKWESSAWTLDLSAKVDEDEGSPLQNGVNLSGVLPGRENRTISGSLPGSHARHIFPSKDNPAQQHSADNRRVKKQWMAKIQ